MCSKSSPEVIKSGEQCCIYRIQRNSAHLCLLLLSWKEANNAQISLVVVKVWRSSRPLPFFGPQEGNIELQLKQALPEQVYSLLIPESMNWNELVNSEVL